MITGFLITFRETLEASLIVSIVLAFLKKTKNEKYNFIVYLAILFSIIFSILFAFLFLKIYGSFSGKSEKIFEGLTMLFGSFLLTTMILWMFKNKHIKKNIEKNISKNLTFKNKLGLFFLVFISIFREGIETVIFLFAASFVSSFNLLFSLLGIIFALFLGYLIYYASIKINLKLFFNISSILLIFFAAGLVAHGFHELEEAGILNPIIKNVWDINPKAPLAEQGIYPLLHEKGDIGSIFKSLFGYNGNPSLLEIICYLLYFVIIIFILKICKK